MLRLPPARQRRLSRRRFRARGREEYRAEAGAGPTITSRISRVAATVPAPCCARSTSGSFRGFARLTFSFRDAVVDRIQCMQAAAVQDGLVSRRLVTPRRRTAVHPWPSWQRAGRPGRWRWSAGTRQRGATRIPTCRDTVGTVALPVLRASLGIGATFAAVGSRRPARGAHLRRPGPQGRVRRRRRARDLHRPRQVGRPVVRDTARDALRTRLGDRVAGLEPHEEGAVVRQMPSRRGQADPEVGSVEATEMYQ